MSLNQPQYNSTIKLLKRLDEYQLSSNKIQQQLNESELEKINEKASSKLNLRGSVYNGLVSVEPDEEDLLKFLEIKQRHRVKPQISSSRSNMSQKPPDLMEFYPNDLIKEFTEVSVEYLKPPKLVPLKASISLINDPIDKYFKWN